MLDAVLQGVYFSAIAVALAMVEVQIEGPNGWAQSLPTWRWGPEWFLRFSSRPVTGYHVWMLTLLVLFCHLPLVYTGFSWQYEARIVSLFLVLTVYWDILWFILNPHYGWARFARRDVWWYKHWLGLFPTDYWLAVAASLALWMTRGVWETDGSSIERLAEWGAVVGVLTAVTLVSDLASSRRG